MKKLTHEEGLKLADRITKYGLRLGKDYGLDNVQVYWELGMDDIPIQFHIILNDKDEESYNILEG